MKIVFFGTPIFAAKILQFLLDSGIEVAAVVTKPDQPQGRSQQPIPTAVKEVALAHHIPLFQPLIVSAPEFAPTLAAFEADIFVVVAYGEILKKHLLEIPKKACINVHGSLLPYYRGAAPIQRAILQGEKETGITIMHMAPKMDAGDMICKVKEPIGENTTFGELRERLCDSSCAPLLQILQAYAKGEAPPRQPQDHEKATFAPKVELEETEIDWTKGAAVLHNLIRGVNPEPGAWCYVTVKGEKKRLKINRTLLVPLSGEPGQILEYGKKKFLIGCGKDALQILGLQLEGKRAMDSLEFMRGLPQEQLQF